MSRTVWAGCLAGLLISCGGKKAPEAAAPKVGWVQDDGWMGACYYPPDFASMGTGERRVARSETLDALMSQWSGERADGVSFDERDIRSVETLLLRFPEKVEEVAARNASACAGAMQGGGVGAWQRWFEGLPSALIAGECTEPLDRTMYDYLDFGRSWQFPASICEGERVRITASRNDYFRVEDGGPWINAEGDRDQPAVGQDHLCNLEGCYVGQLILRWRGKDGGEVIRPVGTQLDFQAPGHGTIEVAINDTTPYNNVFKVERGVQHRTQITYQPID